MVKSHQKQLLEAVLQDASNLWGISVARLTLIYGSNQETDQKMGYSITTIYCVIWMTFFYSSQWRCGARTITQVLPTQAGIWQTRYLQMCEVVQDQVTQCCMGMDNESC